MLPERSFTMIEKESSATSNQIFCDRLKDCLVTINFTEKPNSELLHIVVSMLTNSYEDPS